MEIKRLQILNVWVDSVNMARSIEFIKKTLKYGKRPHSIFAVNPEKNFSVPKNPVLYQSFKNADLLIPDGIGVVIAARVLHAVTLSRVPGVELMNNICKVASDEGYSIFIYGSKEEVNLKASEELIRRYPALKIAGRSDGYIKEENMGALITKINDSKADVLFLALGSPKQEEWLAKYKDRLNNIKVCQGIGGTLDTIAGNVKRAPKFWQNLNLEWFYRLIREPKRIKRQKVLPLFLLLVIYNKMRKAGLNHRLF